MPDLEELIARNRRRLLNREASLVEDIAVLFEAALVELERRAIAAAELVDRRVAAGQSPLSAVVAERRIAALLTQLELELERIAAAAFGRVEAERQAATIAAARDFTNVLGAFDVQAGIDPEAIRRIGLSLLAEAPVQGLFAALPAAAAEAAREALFRGVALGDNPRKVARDLRNAAGMARTRAETIARTEVLRAYREAMRARMGATSEVEGWVWLSARDRRTCPMCWAMHGTVHRKDEAMHTHPNCRCSQGPLPRGTDIRITAGAQAFGQLPAEDQLFVLGPAKYRAYRAGAIDLEDLVGQGTSVKWGPTRFERSLRSVLGVQQAREFYKAA